MMGNQKLKWLKLTCKQHAPCTRHPKKAFHGTGAQRWHFNRAPRCLGITLLHTHPNPTQHCKQKRQQMLGEVPVVPSVDMAIWRRDIVIPPAVKFRTWRSRAVSWSILNQPSAGISSFRTLFISIRNLIIIH